MSWLEAYTTPKKDIPRRAYLTVSLLVAVLLLAVWCVLSYGGLVRADFLPTPGAVLAAASANIKDGSLALHTAVSVSEIMAKGVGGWLKDPKEFKATLTGIKFYGAEDNKAFFGTKDKPGPLSQTVAEAIRVWSSQGRLQVETSPDKLIDYSFVSQ